MALRLISLYLVAICAAHAEPLPDPTRPAVGWNASAQAASVPSGPQLQAIRIQGQARSAMISGETVYVGSKVAGALITRIDEDRVWLRGSQGVQQLKLFPEVEKHMTSSPASPTQRKAQVHPPARKESRKESE